MRKRGEQRGLETPVVHALNHEDSLSGRCGVRSWLPLWGNANLPAELLGGLANALNPPPEEYGRKAKTQRNRRGLIQVVEHVV